jgi:DNA-binding PucR family transcriptional regulator
VPQHDRSCRVGRGQVVLQDDLAAISLRRLLLEPFGDQRGGGTMLRETLRAYFAAERNISSAAVTLGISRNTVANRLREAEARVGRPLHTCGAEL